MKKACFIFLLILPSFLYAQDFTLDEWASLYEKGFFGEVEKPPVETPLYPIDTLGLKFIMEEKTSIDEEEPSVIEKKESFKTDIPGLQLVIEEDMPQEEEETVLVQDDLWDEDALVFEGPPLVFEVPAFEMRSFNDIFPSFTPRQRSSALGRYGLRYYYEKDESPRIVPAPDSGIDLIGSVKKRNPSHIIEALAVVKYMEKEFDLLDIYNALGRIANIKDYPVLLNGSDYFIFTESTRIESSRRRRAVPDPAPATTLPFSDTIYIKLSEQTIGNFYLRGDVSISAYGITYNMTNFADVRYFLVPVMKAERFSTIIYLEPIKEGVLIYCTVGFYLPGYVADRVNLTPNINRRIDVFMSWITDGLRRTEQAAQNNAGAGQ